LPTPADHSAKPSDVLAVGPAPRSIRIDAIGVDAVVAPAGVRPGTNELDLPTDGAAVVWFQGGSRPGEAGSAVLAGHVDWDGEPAVFYDLVELPLGATITVTASDGAARSFVVTGRRSHPKGQLSPDLYRRNGSPVLTLITCGGSFDDDARSYRENVVVEAVPV
jgi:sortase (surface protein transpeptidase)